MLSFCFIFCIFVSFIVLNVNVNYDIEKIKLNLKKKKKKHCTRINCSEVYNIRIYLGEVGKSNPSANRQHDSIYLPGKNDDYSQYGSCISP